MILQPHINVIRISIIRFNIINFTKRNVHMMRKGLSAVERFIKTTICSYHDMTSVLRIHPHATVIAKYCGAQDFGRPEKIGPGAPAIFRVLHQIAGNIKYFRVIRSYHYFIKRICCFGRNIRDSVITFFPGFPIIHRAIHFSTNHLIIVCITKMAHLNIFINNNTGFGVKVFYNSINDFRFLITKGQTDTPQFSVR